MCEAEKINLEGKQTLSSAIYQVFIRQNSLEVNGVRNELEKLCVEFYSYTNEKYSGWGSFSSSGRRKVGQSLIYFLLLRFNPYFAHSTRKKSCPFIGHLRSCTSRRRFASRGSTIEILSMTLTLFTNLVLKHLSYSKMILKLISKCQVCLSVRPHGSDQCIYTTRIRRAYKQCYHILSSLFSEQLNIIIFLLISHTSSLCKAVLLRHKDV